MINYVKIIGWLVMLTISTKGFSNTLTYKISTKSSSIGKLTVVRTTTNGLDVIKINSQVSIGLFGQVDISYQLVSKYKNEELVYSSVYTYVDDKLHSKIITKKLTNQYKVVSDDDVYYRNSPISYTSSLMYFKEPKNITSVFSEFDGELKSVQKMDIHTYKVLSNKGGNGSVYIFKDGLVQRATIEHTLMNFYVSRI